jgi:hypothetical protein
MPKTDRSLLAPAIFGLVTVSFGLGALVVALSDGPTERPEPYPYAAVPPLGLPSASTRAGSVAHQFRSPCDQPSGREDSEICAQWRATQAEEKSAYWAAWSAWVSVFGALGLIISLALTRRAVIVAMNASKLTITPSLFITNLAVWTNGEDPMRPPFMNSEEAIELSAYVVNEGGGAAVVRANESHCQVFWGDHHLPMEPPFDKKWHPMPGNLDKALILESGASKQWRLSTIVEPGKILYVMGVVFCYDEFQRRYTTRFCRKYNSTTKRFDAVIGHPDYEYKQPA